MLILFCFNIGLGDIVVTSPEEIDLAVFGLPFVTVAVGGFAFLVDLALRLCFDLCLRVLVFFTVGFFPFAALGFTAAFFPFVERLVSGPVLLKWNVTLLI